MTAAAAELLSRLHDHGVRARVVGDRVRLEGERPPPPDLLDEARAAKAELLAHLRQVSRCGTVADACPVLIDCHGCGAQVWRPTGETRCLRCADAAAESFAECEIQLGGRWVRARVVSWLRRVGGARRIRDSVGRALDSRSRAHRSGLARSAQGGLVSAAVEVGERQTAA